MTSSVTVCSTWIRGFISMKTWLPARVEQELDGAGVEVADLAGEAHGVGADPVAELRVEVGRRGDLDDLLVAPLHRAVALVEVDHVARGVGEDLHLDVPRVEHGLLEEDRRVAEGGLGLAHAGGRWRRAAAAGSSTRRMPRPPPPATALTNSGKRQRLGGGHQLVDVRRRRRRWPGSVRRPPGPRRSARRLVAGQGEHLGGGPDEGDPGRGAGLGEGRVLRQEAVAGVDRVGARAYGDRDDRLGVEVGAHRVAALADLVGLVGLEPVLGPRSSYGKTATVEAPSS